MFVHYHREVRSIDTLIDLQVPTAAQSPHLPVARQASVPAHPPFRGSTPVPGFLPHSRGNPLL